MQFYKTADYVLESRITFSNRRLRELREFFRDYSAADYLRIANSYSAYVATRNKNTRFKKIICEISVICGSILAPKCAKYAKIVPP